uniref:50S ribosomal protein L19, chloroplastic n=1 Tax=Gymnochlora stellata TaxID=67809 RepID=A0A140JZG3_GYMST|nr:50S ribosomal protein L19 [Gymnochlora stellata]BAU62490.1 50S ribosomal protein L19 [Gymnochlora stellata]
MILSQVLSKVEQCSSKKEELPFVSVGDLIQVRFLIKEGTKERIQQYEGTVISKKANDILTVRRIFQGIGMEYVFPLSVPQIVSLVIKKQSKIRRSKLFYLRNRIGKKAQLKRKITSLTNF